MCVEISMKILPPISAEMILKPWPSWCICIATFIF